MEPISSRANARLKAVRRLQAKRHRLREGLFVAEGEDIVEEGMAEGLLPVESFVAAERAPDETLVQRLARGGPVHVVADTLLAELGTLGHPARVLSVFRHADLPVRSTAADLGVHLHRVIDPGNVGTVVRAAGALGPAFVTLSAGCSDPYSGKGVRASMGAIFRVPIESPAEPADGIRRDRPGGRRWPAGVGDRPARPAGVPGRGRAAGPPRGADRLQPGGGEHSPGRWRRVAERRGSSNRGTVRSGPPALRSLNPLHTDGQHAAGTVGAWPEAESGRVLPGRSCSPPVRRCRW